ncbi:MAG: peptide-methionine (R)-S-oxide reductase MsrB [Nitrospirae bacterium]|nr:peptide-methionine (R)-S-oxide reductase MsrB [Nitrospirota bacterium]
MTRRAFLFTCIALVLANRFDRRGFSGTESPHPRIETIRKTPEEWKALLTPEQYRVLRQEGTEPPHSSPLLKNKDKGLYVCAGCELPLFTSEMKYDSHTGWPSFYTSIQGRLDTKPDHKLIHLRTEYHCARCGGHQGHLFDDGPRPTYQRWCNNGVALKFIGMIK